MFNEKPKTYNELILIKKCCELKKYYNISMDLLEEIYNFLSENQTNSISITTINNTLIFYETINQNMGVKDALNNTNSSKSIVLTPIDTNIHNKIDMISIKNNSITIVPHYVPSSSSGGWSSGGGSSNNNNNNNNNN